MNKALSLCVPTYNRAPLLAQSLRAILSQIKPDQAAQVEVLVMDNASPDSTPQVVAQAQADFPHVQLRSVRHPENIGPDANFLEAVTQAQGEYVYLLSDDDVLLPGAVDKLLTLIQAHPEFDAFCLNVRQFRGHFQEDRILLPALSLSADKVIEGRDAALLFLGTHITFISAMAFRRSNIAGKDYRDKVATMLLQSYFFWMRLRRDAECMPQQAFLAQRADNNEGFGFFKVFVAGYAAVMQYARQAGYSSEAVRQVLQWHLYFINHYVLAFKTQDDYRKIQPSYATYLRNLGPLLRMYGANPYLLRTIIPRMLIPRSVYYPLKRFYKRLKQ